MAETALLEKVAFFQPLSSDELAEIDRIVSVAAYRPGQRVFEEGAACDSFFIIKSGTVMVKTGGIVLATLSAGEPIGEMSFIDKGPRSASVTAIEETNLITVSADALDGLLSANPAMAAKVYKTIALLMCKRLRETGDMINLRFKPARY